MKVALCMLLVVLGTVASAPAAVSDEIVITGNPSPTNRKEFVWTITNRTDKPITMFRASHYLALRVTPPDGWEESRMTGNIRRGQKQKQGIIEFKAKSAANGIRPGQTKVFGIKLAPEWDGIIAEHSVIVGLDDDREVVIAGVQCPVIDPWLRRNMSLVGLGAMFAIFLTIKALRGTKKEAKPAAQTGLD